MRQWRSKVAKAELVSKFLAMAEQSGKGGAKWQWRSKVVPQQTSKYMAMAEQSGTGGANQQVCGNGGAKRQWRSK